MGIIMGALGGMGSAMQNIGETQMKAGIDRESKAMESDLATQRAQSLEVFKNNLKNAPMERLGAKAQEFAGIGVPLEAAPVTSLSGNNPRTEEQGPGQGGFTGDPKGIMASIMALPDGPDKEAALAQLKTQYAADSQTQQGIVSGKTRKRTSDEAMAAAVEDAKAGDLVAYADYEAKIGKPLREERRIDVTDKRTEAQMSTAAKESARKEQADARRYEIDLKRLDLQQGTLEASNRKIDAWIENETTKRENDATKDAGGKGQSPDKLGAIVNAMNATVAKLTSIDTPRGRTAEEKAEWQAAYNNAVRVRDRATQLLDNSLTDRGAPAVSATPTPAKPTASGPTAPAAFPQGSRQVGTSGGKPVYETPDGKRFIQK